MPLLQLQSRLCDAAAEVILEQGIDGLSPSAVAVRSGVSTARVRRAYKNRPELAAGLYRHGRARIEQLCALHPRTGTSGLAAVIALVYDLVDQAAADPAVRVLHSLEASDLASVSGMESIYRAWRRQFIELLTAGGDLGTDPPTDQEYSKVIDVVDILVGAVAGFSDPHSATRTDLDATFDRLDLLLHTVIPVLCVDDRHARHMSQYLSRVRSTLRRQPLKA